MCLVTIGNSKTHAASSSTSSITVRPFLQSITIKPNEANKQFQLFVSNNSDFTQVFHLSTLNFGALNDTGGLIFQGANVNKLAGKYGLSNWIDLGQKELRLQPNSQAPVKVTISNDSSLAPGAHYAAVIITASSPFRSRGQLTVNPKISSLIFATKLGGEKYDMHLQAVNDNGGLFKLPTQVTVNFKSTGNTYVIPRGVVSLLQGNTLVARGAINQQSGLVLPEASRNFDVTLNKIASPKKGILFTRYSVRTDYRYDGISQFATNYANGYTLNKLSIVLLVSFFILLTLALFKKHKLIAAFKNLRKINK